MVGLDCAEGTLGGESVWGEGTGDGGDDGDGEEFGQADAVGGYVFIFVWGDIRRSVQMEDGWQTDS